MWCLASCTHKIIIWDFTHKNYSKIIIWDFTHKIYLFFPFFSTVFLGSMSHWRSVFFHVVEFQLYLFKVLRLIVCSAIGVYCWVCLCLVNSIQEQWAHNPDQLHLCCFSFYCWYLDIWGILLHQGSDLIELFRCHWPVVRIFTLFSGCLNWNKKHSLQCCLNYTSY